MKNILLLLLLGLFLIGCRLKDKHGIEFLSKASGLKIPTSITNVQYRYIKNDDYNYPYYFYSRFKCDSGDYLIIRNQMFVGEQTGMNNSNLIISSKILAKDKAYLYADNQIDWWDVRNTVTPNRLYVNYFYDQETKHIGDSTNFNGKIALFYRSPYCYLYILCFPPQ
ncbi:hypothetical protein [Chitinophaga sancti]|uniref:hypothetical protein n=1 Tax=Chitinophaga sancti TaxID=1004 RepID=UPI003F798E27